MVASAVTALALTLAVEAPLVGVIGHRLRQPRWRILAAGLLPSLLSHPLAWQAWSRLSPQDYATGVMLIETGVCLVEAVLLWAVLRLRWHLALSLSLLANAASATLGWLGN